MKKFYTIIFGCVLRVYTFSSTFVPWESYVFFLCHIRLLNFGKYAFGKSLCSLTMKDTHTQNVFRASVSCTVQCARRLQTILSVGMKKCFKQNHISNYFLFEYSVFSEGGVYTSSRRCGKSFSDAKLRRERCNWSSICLKRNVMRNERCIYIKL